MISEQITYAGEFYGTFNIPNSNIIKNNLYYDYHIFKDINGQKWIWTGKNYEYKNPLRQ